MAMKKKIRNFYRENRTAILVGIVSVLIGGLMVGVNVWNYQTSRDIYELTPETASETKRTLSEAKPFLTTFRVDEARELDSLTVVVKFEEVKSTASFDITMNNQVLQKGLTGLSSGATHQMNPDPTLLSRSNRIMVEGTFGVSAMATIESVTVTGYTNAGRYSYLILNLIGLIIAIGPVMAIKYRQYQNRAKLEERFPDFIRDVVEGVRSGMSLPQAIENTEDNDYGYLTQYVDSMSAKINWGIPFDQVLRDFAAESGSKVIKRASNTIIQSYDSGGNVSDVLATVGKNIDKIRQLNKERESELHGQVVTGYIVYFIFLAVMVALIKYLVPALTFSGDIPEMSAGMSIFGGAGGSSVEEIIALYRPIFRNLVVIQSVFSGLVIGKLSEGELRAGAKHVAILLSVGYTVAVLFM